MLGARHTHAQASVWDGYVATVHESYGERLFGYIQGGEDYIAAIVSLIAKGGCMAEGIDCCREGQGLCLQCS